MGRKYTYHGGYKHPLYATWNKIVARCALPTCTGYQNYGGRGITVCDRWMDFWNFVADMAPRPAGMTIDRIDNDGPYNPENCRWASNETQGRNRRTNRLIEVGGKVMTLTDWAEQSGIPHSSICSRLRRGWSESDAVTRPRKGDHRLHIGANP